VPHPVQAVTLRCVTEESAASAAIDFDRAQPLAEAAAMLCAACKREIAQTYYAVNSRYVCPSCHQGFVAAQDSGGSTAAALLFGVGAAVAGAVLYHGVAALTGYEVGLVAIVVGVMVGKAVRKGAGMRAVAGHRWLALALAYVAITATYIPQLLETDGAHSFPRALALALMMPAFMLTNVRSALGLVILGIGLYEAWKYSAPPVFVVEGPFLREPAAPVPAAPVNESA
jgi:hypothetical protein